MRTSDTLSKEEFYYYFNLPTTTAIGRALHIEQFKKDLNHKPFGLCLCVREAINTILVLEDNGFRIIKAHTGVTYPVGP